MIRFTIFLIQTLACLVFSHTGFAGIYPPEWFAPVTDPNKPEWEILPQDAKPGEVILSKRNELGVLSNFAATPFTYKGKRYASVEGFWQMMKFPEGPDDERSKFAGLLWPHTREEVGQMTAFDAKHAGDVGSANMKKMKIDWVSFEGKHFAYRSAVAGEHHRLIREAMKAKLDQHKNVHDILKKTGDLILRPDHTQEANDPPEWRYFDVWMEYRKALKK